MARTRKEKGSDLTDLEKRFAVYYLESFNATQAYLKASTGKPNPVTAAANGYKILGKPRVQEAIKAERDARMKKAGLSVDETMDKLRQFLTYDVRKLFGDDAKPLHVTELSDDMAAAIVGIKVVTKGNADMGYGEVTEFKLADKVAALEKAMKYHGLFERDNKQQAEALKEIAIKLVKPS